MDHCPREGQTVDVRRRLMRLDFGDRLLQVAFLFSAVLTLTALVFVTVSGGLLTEIRDWWPTAYDPPPRHG